MESRAEEAAEEEEEEAEVAVPVATSEPPMLEAEPTHYFCCVDTHAVGALQCASCRPSHPNDRWLHSGCSNGKKMGDSNAMCAPCITVAVVAIRRDDAVRATGQRRISTRLAPGH